MKVAVLAFLPLAGRMRVVEPSGARRGIDGVVGGIVIPNDKRAVLGGDAGHEG
jgi:hypothetical protein